MNKRYKDINYSEIPVTDEAFWANATVYLPKKLSRKQKYYANKGSSFFYLSYI